MARPFLLFGVAAGLLGVLFLAVALALEDRFIFFPSRELVGTPTDVGLEYQDVYFTSDGQQLHGWFVPGPRDITWLWLHGNAGNISHRLENMAMIYHRLGVNIFIFDYRGYGQSQGKPSERGTYRDADAALAYLRSLRGIDQGRILFFGRSLGAAVAVELATRERPAALILESAFTSVPALARRHYPLLPMGPLLRTRYDSLSRIKKVSAPLMVIHSLHDEIVPYEEGRRLFDAAPDPKTFHTIAQGGHNETYLLGGAEYWLALERFLSSLK